MIILVPSLPNSYNCNISNIVPSGNLQKVGEVAFSTVCSSLMVGCVQSTNLSYSAVESGVISLDMIPFSATTSTGERRSPSGVIRRPVSAPPKLHVWLPMCVSYLTFQEMLLAERTSRHWRQISRSSAVTTITVNVLGTILNKFPHLYSLLISKNPMEFWEKDPSHVVSRLRYVEHIQSTRMNQGYVINAAWISWLPRVKTIDINPIDYQTWVSKLTSKEVSSSTSSSSRSSPSTNGALDGIHVGMYSQAFQAVVLKSLATCVSTLTFDASLLSPTVLPPIENLRHQAKSDLNSASTSVSWRLQRVHIKNMTAFSLQAIAQLPSITAISGTGLEVQPVMSMPLLKMFTWCAPM
jgi:hypothetical protein